MAGFRYFIVIYLIVIGILVDHTESQQPWRNGRNELRKSRFSELRDDEKAPKGPIASQARTLDGQLRGYSMRDRDEATCSWSRWQLDERAKRIVTERTEEKQPLESQRYEEMWYLAAEVLRSLEMEDLKRDGNRSEAAKLYHLEIEAQNQIVQYETFLASTERPTITGHKDPAVLAEERRRKTKEYNKRKREREKMAALRDPAVLAEQRKKKRENNQRQRERKKMAGLMDPAILEEQRNRERENNKRQKERGLRDPEVLQAQRMSKSKSNKLQKERLKTAGLSNSTILLEQRKKWREKQKRRNEKIKMAGMKDPGFLEAERWRKLEIGKRYRERLKDACMKDPAFLEAQREKAREKYKRERERALKDPAFLEELRKKKRERSRCYRERLKQARLRDPTISLVQPEETGVKRGAR